MKTISNECKCPDSSLSAEQQQACQALKVTKAVKVDAPSARECNFDNAHSSKKPSRSQKERIYTSVDKDLLDWLKQPGKGYQTRLNAVLRWARSNGCPLDLL